MKQITFKNALITLLMIVACMVAINVKAQSTCATAVSFTPSDTFKVTTYNITDSIYWLKFVADSNISLQIVPPNKTPQASILHIYLYSGTCSSLTLLASKGVNDSLLITLGSLSVGSTYYVKVNRTATTSAYFGLGFQCFTGNTLLFCLPTNCNLIANGLFETNLYPLFIDCPFYNWSLGLNDTLNEVCGWRRAWGSPQIKPYTASGNHYAYLWGEYDPVAAKKEGEGIIQTINIPAGTYNFNFSYQVAFSSMDSFIVCLTTSNFIPSNQFAGDPIPYSTWHPNQRDIIYAAASVPVSGGIWHHVSVPSLYVPSAYPYLVIYPAQSSTNYTVLLLDSVSIIAQPPDPPIITGQWDLCHGTPPITSDTIKNWNSQYSYYWNIGKNGTQTHFTTSTFNVNWTGHTGGGMLYVEVFNDSTHCSAVDSFKVFGCCDANYIHPYADTTISSPSTINGPKYIDGQLIINANVTIGGGNIYMGPNAQIIINPGKTLKVYNNSVLQAGCDTMWDGIYINGNTAHLRDSGSTMEQAKNAIVSLNGGDFQVKSNALLKNNYKNVVVNAYSSTHTGKISQTTITCDSTINLLPQYPPVTATRTYDGVEINSVNTIYIGDTTAYTNRNTFNYMDYGIKSGCSQIYVYNNKFLNIERQTAAAYAVNIFGARNCLAMAVVGKQNIQGLYFSNYFKNCYFGIYLNSSMGCTLKAEYDTLVMQTLSHTTPTGIYTYTNSASNVTMRYNKITNGGWGYGIDCANFGANSTVKINSNYIQNAPWGINVSCINSTTPNSFQIAKNYISFPNSYTTTQTGIQVTNVQGSSNKRLSLLQNRIKFNTPNFNYTAYGIRVQNSTLDSIEQCSVTNTNTAPSDTTSAKNFNGIQVELSPNSYLCEDTAVNMGCGLRFVGSMPSSTIDVNYMNSNTYIGIRLDGANVGNQGTAALCNGNQWNANPKYRLQGTWTQVFWYYYGAGPASMSLSPLGTYVYLTPPAATWVLPATNFISTCTVGSMQMILSNTVQDIVNNSYNYTVNIAENRYTDNTTAYNILKNDPGILSSAALNDAKYQAFYNTTDAGTIGQIYRINNLMQQQDYNNALLMNTTFAPSNFMEQNRKAVNDVYLNTWANGIFTFTDAEYNTLYTIAVQNPVLAGNAVYSARVMLGIDGSETPSSSSRQANTSNNNAQSVVGKIYPNPTKDEAYLDYHIKDGQKGELQFYSVTGKLLSEYPMNSESNKIIINTAVFSSGIYFYKIIVDKTVIANEKLVIIK